jgi:DNA polymerase-4
MRRILHVDMDAFYASVEQLDNPALRNRPVIVGADPKDGTGRGVVAACSYEARKFGIHSAMPISQAWRRCRQAAYLSPRMVRYQEVSRQIMAVFENYTDLVEPLSIDEAFLDVTGSIRLMGPAEDIARNVKEEIRQETGLTASVGVAHNKFLAKVASDLDKPDGIVVVPPDGAEAFLRFLPISKLWGVGPKTAARLQKLGVGTIGELASIPQSTIFQTLGRTGEHLWRLAHGEDERAVVPNSEPKSISNETTFAQDTGDKQQIVGALRRLSDKVAARLRKKEYRARTISLKLRYASFTTYTRQSSLAEATDEGDVIFETVLTLFEKFPLEEHIRLIGVGSASLAHSGDNNFGHDQAQLDLFTSPQRPPQGNRKLSHALDEIHERFGEDSVHRASDLP